MAGIVNNTVYGTNVDFSGQAAPAPTITTNGQMLIGTTSLNAGGTHINVGTLTSTGGSIAITYNSPNINLETTSSPSSGILTLSDDVNTQATPDGSGNIELFGHVNNQTSKFSTVLSNVSAAHTMNINPMSGSRWIVDKLGFNGTHTTISSALASASSGDTIVLLPGTYTENITAVPGVNITGQGGDAFGGIVTINGTITCTTAGGTYSFSNINFENTSSANILSCTGSNSYNVRFSNCNFNVTTATGLLVANNNAIVTLTYCFGLNTTNSNAFFALSGGILNLFYFWHDTTDIGNSTVSGGTLNMQHCRFASTITTSGSSSIIQIEWCQFPLGTLCIAHNGTSNTQPNVSFIQNSRLYGGSSVPITVGAGATLYIYNCAINSNTTSNFTGSGTVQFCNLSFIGTVFGIGTTGQIPYGKTNDAMPVKIPGSYPYTCIGNDYLVLVDTTTNRTINLPASPVTGQVVNIKDATGLAGTYNIIINGNGNTIDGLLFTTNAINTNWGCNQYIYGGTKWIILGQFTGGF